MCPKTGPGTDSTSFTVSHGLLAIGKHSKRAFPLAARKALFYKLRPILMGGGEQAQRNTGAVNLYRIAQALDMSLSELFAR
jgi:hypothetical protein